MVRQAKKEIKLPLLEEELQKKWREEKLYEKSEKKRGRGKKFYFLDGPPYASGAIHLGTAWNKIIKDAILRYLALKGYKVKKQPGWDCHGLPIEVKVESKLGIKSKKEIETLGVEKFVQACESWANEHIAIMTAQFSRLGIFMDWDKPYKTMSDAYIEAAWWTLKKAHEKNLLVEDLRVVTFCPRCETALAEAEIEYDDIEDPSIYVKFPLKGNEKGGENEFLLVWTTTPWTLIGNLAVMVNPEHEYAKAKTREGVLIVAKELLPILKDKLNLDYEIAETLKGGELEHLRYTAPLEGLIELKLKNRENAYYVILSKDVVLTEGTGLVHCAPGHGPEDFEAGKRYGIEPLCPVDEQGRFKEEAGVYKGLRAKKDDAKIVADLKARNLLLKEEKISHRYGHCWRCSTPIIYRATAQWFLKITEMKEKMLSEIEKPKWVPEWAGSARFKDWIEGARDWTISRQRYWGIPLPLWKCKSCGSIEVMGSKKELEKKSGRKVKELHRPYVDEAEIKCSKCGEKVKRASDVLDVWFDSGTAVWASLADGKKKIETLDSVADLIIEGHDQTRGWFYSLLGCGMISFGGIPYRKVLMHGFTLDEKGEKMSKSLGNVITPEEVIGKHGADVLRFYVLWANKPWEDLKFSWKEIEVISRMFNILWNSHVFATTYMSLDKFAIEKHKNAAKHYGEEDKWMVSRLNSLIKEVSSSFETLELYRGARALHDFIIEDLSRWYIPLIRSKTWIESESMEKLASYHALYRVLHSLSVILVPFSPHIAEEIFCDLSAKSSPMLESWVEAEENEIDVPLEEDMKAARKLVEEALALREKAGMKRRWPIQKVIFKAEEKHAHSARRLSKIIKTTINAKELETAPKEQSIAGDFISSSFELGELLLDKTESEELKAEGFAREIVRRIQSMRKELNLDVEAFINTNVEVKSEKVKEYIELQRNYIVRETRTKELSVNAKPFSFAKKWAIKEEELYISIAQVIS